MYKYLFALALVIAAYDPLKASIQVKWKTLLPPTGLADSYINSSAITSDNSKVYYSGSYGIHIVDLESGEYQGLLEGGVGCDRIVLSPDDKYLFATVSNDILKIDIEGKQVIKTYSTLKHGTNTFTDISPDGRQLAISAGAGLVIINTETMELAEEVKEFPNPLNSEEKITLDNPNGVSFSHDGRYVAISNRKDFTIIYDLEQDKTVDYLKGTRVSLSSNDRRAVVITNKTNVGGTYTGYAYYPDFLSSDSIFIEMTLNSSPSCMVLSQTNYIALAAGDTRFQFFNTETQEPKLESSGEYQIVGLAQSKDGRYISGAGILAVLFDLLTLSAPEEPLLLGIELIFNDKYKEVQIENKSEVFHNYILTLTNIAGESLLNEPFPIVPSEIKKVSLNKYPSGTYILSIRDQKHTIKSININITK